MDVSGKHLHNRSLENYSTDEFGFELGLLASKVAYYNFEWRFLTIVMFNTMHVIGLNTFLKHYQQSVIVKLGRYLPARRAAVPQIVIFGEDSSEISSTLRWAIKAKYDSSGKFIIICAFLDQDCDEQKIFQTLQSLYILNVVLLKLSTKNNTALAYSYDIIDHGKCTNNVPYSLHLLPACKNDDCFKNLYPERLSNFHGCALRMSTIEQAPFMYLHNGTKRPSGIDGDIMMLAANMLNATLMLTTPADGGDAGHFSNNNWTGSLGDVYNDRRQASVCSAPLSSTKYGNFQISFPYYSMDIVWATSLPPQKASWEKLLSPLSVYLRVTLFCFFIVITFVNTLCKSNIWRQVRRAFEIEPPKYSFLFFSWVLFLGFPILREPARKSFVVTIYTWIWFCFIIRSAYQAALINSLKQPAYLNNLETFLDVFRLGHRYGGLVALKEYYTADRPIYDNWVVVDLDHFPVTLDNIIFGTTDFVLASNKDAIKHHLMKYNGTKQLQIIPEKIVNSPTVIYFKKFSPLAVPVNTVLRTALEGGFIQRIHDKYLAHDRKLFQRVRNRRPEPLRMSHFAGSFVLLILGWSVSATYFAVEYVCGNLAD
uniref:Putative ionotropic receptor IR7d.1 n=1 Tax=Athetis lepigone TaxID=1223490 RepID=A0A1B3B710_ATHLE|nr:putative ionotropic receptor IR7d.1 [Athetis lepigone]